MEKRLFFAIALSLLVLIFWSAFITKAYHVDNKEVTKNIESTPVAVKPAPVISQGIPEKEQKATTTVTLERDAFDLVFTESDASLKKVVFKKHQNHVFSLSQGLLVQDQNLLFKVAGQDSRSVSFVARDSEKKVIKKFEFSDDNYDFFLTVLFDNNSASPLKIKVPLEIGELDFSNSAQSQFIQALVKNDEKVHFLNAKKNESFSAVNFAGIKDQYFCVIVDPDQDAAVATVNKVNNQMSKLYLETNEISIDPGKSYEFKYRIYLGPQDIGELNKVNPNWAVFINYGTFDLISQVLLQMLYFIYKLVHNWGVAIVLLSILIYFCLYPLTLKQMRSMKEMQLLQPHIEELKCKYKDNPQKLNKEIMELYREHKVNPFGGCLPLILQMPIFFALYQALMRSIVLKGADFMWIKDLSLPDRLFLFPGSVPFIGNEFNLLPIIMAIGMFFQQKMSMSSASVGSNAEQQKMMLVLFPILFGFIFYHMPSGLVLYWLTNSILTITFQYKTTQIKTSLAK
jgi:YidC/Oxa1 family membrane protein insertase